MGVVKRERVSWYIVMMAGRRGLGVRSSNCLSSEGGGGWTECEVAELKNGSVLLTSRNFYDGRSGYGPRMF